jgi:hypothetical protein
MSNSIAKLDDEWFSVETSHRYKPCRCEQLTQDIVELKQKLSDADTLIRSLISNVQQIQKNMDKPF